MYKVNGKLHSSVDRLAPTSAGSVVAARPEFQQAGGGAIPTPALQSLRLAPVPFNIARDVFVQHHYLHSAAGATILCFGVFEGGILGGAMSFGRGPAQACRLVRGASPRDCAALTRLWLSDSLPKNAESRVVSIALRHLRRHTSLKFVVTYADPAAGHKGTIYRAGNWLFTGMSDPTPRLDLGDGIPRHSRTVSSLLGSRSETYLHSLGFEPTSVAGASKYRFVYFLDLSWQPKLTVPLLPYPRKEDRDARC